MKYLALLVLLLAGCATNSGLDHRITCTLEGKANFVITYGPVAITDPVPDADAICATMTKTPQIVVTPAAISASTPTKAASSAQ